MTSFEIFRLVLDFASLTVAFAAFGYAWMQSKHRARKEQLAELDGALKAQGVEIAALRDRTLAAEGKLKGTPTDKALHELAMAIERLTGDFKAHGAQLEGLTKIVQRLETVTNRQENFLLNTGGGKR